MQAGRRKLRPYPALAGRQVICGLRQSIPSSEGLQEYPLW